MIDLTRTSPELFAPALLQNLRRLGPMHKLSTHFLHAVRVRLEADCVWLYRDGEKVVRGDGALCDDALVTAFARGERLEVPHSVLLSRVVVAGRSVAIAGAARRSDFEMSARRSLGRLCDVLAEELSRREEERLARVLDRIRGKIVSELRPRDVAYQILDGLHQLVDYDHSSAFLAYDAGASVFRIEAEKIVWTKAKSGFVGHEIAVTAEQVEALSRASAIRHFGAAGGEDVFQEVLDYSRGQAIPPVRSILAAPLFFGGEFLGLLKIASGRKRPFDRADLAVVERFLPSAAVSMRNAQVHRSHERQAMQAERKASLVTLARAVAHDVNNAVGSILPLAQQVRADLQRDTFDRATLDQDLAVIIDNARFCQRIFSNMLRAAGAGRSGDGPVDLNQAVSETLPFLQGQAERRGIAVVLDLDADLPAVYVSRQDLEHIVLNLVSNALEAMADEGGRIAVSTRREGNQAVLTVADDGPGIAQELLGKVQEPFFTTKPGGTGLGLSICRSLAWQNGGAFEIRSRLGEGTAVRVLLRTDEGVEAPTREDV